MRGIGYGLALAVALQVVLVRDAQAYLDPGTGSFVFQTIVAIVVGAGFTLKLYWNRLKGVLGRRASLPAEVASQPTNEDRAGS